MAVARQVLGALDRAPTYCRIDLIRHVDGTLRVMELEAIEPDLFLEHDRPIAHPVEDSVVRLTARDEPIPRCSAIG